MGNCVREDAIPCYLHVKSSVAGCVILSILFRHRAIYIDERVEIFGAAIAAISSARMGDCLKSGSRSRLQSLRYAKSSCFDIVTN